MLKERWMGIQKKKNVNRNISFDQMRFGLISWQINLSGLLNAKAILIKE